MKTNARIVVSDADADRSLIDRLRSVFDEQSVPRGFLCVAPVDDPRTREVIGLLEGAGLKPWDFTKGVPFREGAEYFIRLEREYSRSDLAECEYLEIFLPPRGIHLKLGSRDDSGRLIVFERKMPRGFAIMRCCFDNTHFVRDQARVALESAGVQHVTFCPVTYRPLDWKKGDTDETVAARHGTPYWELDSDFTMPRLSSSLRITDGDGRTVDRDYDFSNGMQTREGLFIHPELRYRRSDLDKLEPFDLARTYEPLGNYRSYSRRFCPLIASRRFYETCVANKLKTGWVPVRIDPD